MESTGSSFVLKGSDCNYFKASHIEVYVITRCKLRKRIPLPCLCSYLILDDNTMIELSSFVWKSLLWMFIRAVLWAVVAAFTGYFISSSIVLQRLDLIGFFALVGFLIIAMCITVYRPLANKDDQFEYMSIMTAQIPNLVYDVQSNTIRRVVGLTPVPSLRTNNSLTSISTVSTELSPRTEHAEPDRQQGKLKRPVSVVDQDSVNHL